MLQRLRMDYDMAPPNKRRRISSSTARSVPSHSDVASEVPSATLRHSVEHLNHKPMSTAGRTVPHHIQEIHLQIQERAVVKNKGYHPLHLRQATAVETDITSINDAGQTIVTEITVGATTTTPTPAASGTTDSTTSSNSSSSTSSNLSDSGGTQTTLANSHNGTSTHTSTKDTTRHDSSRTTILSNHFTATLTNGNLVTLTRSKNSYKTTFADGETLTVCGQNSQCRLESTASTQSPDDASPTSTPLSATTSTAYAIGGAAQGGSVSPTSTAGSGVQQNNSDDSTPPPGTIAGGVVGGAAGLAVILLLAMILLRWYKRRKQLGHHALAPSSVYTSEPQTPSSRGPGMAERAGIRPLASAVPAFFKHSNRSDIEPPPSERSFQKISGRKLPSAYSEGMSSADVSTPPPSVPSTGVPPTGPDRNLSSLSFYRDSRGFYGGDGATDERAVSPDDVPPMQSENSGVLLSPGPQRKPTVHTGGPYNMTPSSSVPSTPHMQSPNLATIPGSPTEHPRTINRCSTPSTVPDNRSSRFTEEV